MLKKSRHRTSWVAAVAVVLTVAGPAGPAAATKRVVATHVRAAASPATVLAGGVVTVTGTVTPKSAGPVALQRLVGKVWTTVAHARESRTGGYTFTLHSPKKPATLALRVTRAVSATTTSGNSATVHVHVVKSAFTVTAKPAAAALTTAQRLAISGKVTPKGSGSVSLDKGVGKRWVSLGKARLSKGSAYVFNKSLPAGSYKLRVSKAFSSTVAGGTSRSFRVVVSVAAGPPTAPPPPSNPVVATSSLTPMAVGKPAVRTLSATSGTGPYTWSVASGALPAGLSLVPTGVVSGTPLTVAVTSFTVRVTDALGHSGTGSVTSTVRPVVVRAWGTNGYDELGSDGGDPDTIVTTAAPNSTSAVAGGFRYALVLETDGSVWAWGANDQGELGLGDTQSRNVPTKIAGLSNIVAIAAGRTSAYAVSAAGLVYAWGANGSGEIGDGYTIERHTPVNLPTLTNIVSVAAGDRFALALDASGRVHSWGRGDNGVLGNGLNTTQQTTPVLADPFISPAVAISASSTASYAVLADGTVNAWGLKEHGQLGHVQSPVAAPDDPSPVPVDGLTGVTALSCTGFEFCLALRHDGSVWAWGYGMYGEMGNGATSDGATAAQVPGLSDVVAVATANQTGFALRGTGTVSSWGYDHHNALGSGDPNDLGTLSPATIPGLTEVVGLGAGYENGYALQAG